MFTVSISWPPRCLLPNAKAHWAVRAKAASKCRIDACYAAMAAGARALKWQGADVAIEFCPPDRRRRDVDGMLSALKSSLDGIADATGVDDGLWTISMTRGEPVKNGEVVVTISER